MADLTPEQQRAIALARSRRRQAEAAAQTAPEAAGAPLVGDPREALVSVASSAVAEPISGLAGILGGIAGLVPGGESPIEKAARFQTGTQEALTVEPVTPLGQETLKVIGKGAELGVKGVRLPVAGISGLAQLPFGGVEGAAETTRRITEQGIGPTAGAALERVGAPPIVSTIADILPISAATVAGVKFPRGKPPVKPTQQPTISSVATPDGPQVSVGRPSLDTPVDFTPVSPVKVIEDIRKGRPEQLAQEVLPDPKVVEAAQRLGVDLNVEHYSTNTAFQSVARALKSQPESRLNAAEVQAFKDLADRADELVVDIGGQLDRGQLSADILDSTRNTIDDLQQQADVGYKQVREAIPNRTQVDTTDLRAFVDERLADLGGDKALLGNAERALFNMLERSESGSITYAALDRFRRDIGEGFNQRTGPFADDSQRTLREVYDSLSQTQNGVAEAMGVGDVYTSARQLVATRKGLEDQLVGLFGRDAAGSLVPKIQSAARGLPKGDVTAFNKLISALPEARRGEVAASVLGELFSGGSRQGGQLGTGFALIWRNLNRNKAARDTLLRQLPKEARQRFDDIGRVIDGIVRSNAKPLGNPSGSAGPIIRALEEGTIATRLFGAGRQVAVERALGSVPVFGTLLRRAGGADSPVGRIQAADAFLTSQGFKDSVSVALKGDLAKANRIAENSPQFKKWITTMPEGTAEEIARLGFMSWLAGEQQ